MNLDYLKKNKTSLAVAVMAVYLSYITLSQGGQMAMAKLLDCRH